MSKLAVTVEGRTYIVELRAPQGHEQDLLVLVDQATVPVRMPDPEHMQWVAVDGRPYELLIDRDLHWIKTQFGLHKIEVRDLDAAVARPAMGDGRVKAPIPGMISKIRVAIGQHVEVGEPIIVLEAMKMQNELRAPRTGVITAIHVAEGQTVVRAEVLAEVVDAPTSEE